MLREGRCARYQCINLSALNSPFLALLGDSGVGPSGRFSCACWLGVRLCSQRVLECHSKVKQEEGISVPGPAWVGRRAGGIGVGSAHFRLLHGPAPPACTLQQAVPLPRGHSYGLLPSADSGRFLHPPPSCPSRPFLAHTLCPARVMPSEADSYSYRGNFFLPPPPSFLNVPLLNSYSFLLPLLVINHLLLVSTS